MHHSEDMFSDTNVIIDYHGNVTWQTEGLLHTSCSLDVTRYPFDVQVCPMKFGPWSYPVTVMKLNPVVIWDPVGPTFHNTEWSMVQVSVVHSDDIGFTNTKYSSVTYNVTLQRKPIFVLFNLVRLTNPRTT